MTVGTAAGEKPVGRTVKRTRFIARLTDSPAMKPTSGPTLLFGDFLRLSGAVCVLNVILL
jgi:hypothetical protein